MQYGRFGEQLKVAKICRGGARGFAQLRVIILTAPRATWTKTKEMMMKKHFSPGPRSMSFLTSLSGQRTPAGGRSPRSRRGPRPSCPKSGWPIQWHPAAGPTLKSCRLSKPASFPAKMLQKKLRRKVKIQNFENMYYHIFWAKIMVMRSTVHGLKSSPAPIYGESNGTLVINHLNHRNHQGVFDEGHFREFFRLQKRWTFHGPAQFPCKETPSSPRRKSLHMFS